MSKNGGILDCSPGCLTVNFSRVLWFKPPDIQKEIKQFWLKQGYCEAESLPYERTTEGLIVTRNINFLYQVGTGTLDEEVDSIPF